METMKEKINSTFGSLKSDFGYTNTMQAPRLEKVVVSTGVGKISDNNTHIIGPTEKWNAAIKLKIPIKINVAFSNADFCKNTLELSLAEISPITLIIASLNSMSVLYCFPTKTVNLFTS